MDISQFKFHHTEMVYYDDYAFLDSLSTEKRQKYLPQDITGSEARWYDSLLGRTTTMDPLGEKYYSLSPYLWCAGKSGEISEFRAFKQNVDDPDFFEKSIIFQRYDDSTFNYQYHYMDLMKYPFLR